MKSKLIMAMAACVVLCGGMMGRASVYTLSDENSSVSLDPSTSYNMYTWTVDGTVQLYQQGFWYAIGTAAQQSLDTLAAPTVTQLDAATLKVGYVGTGLTVNIIYALTGGALHSNSSDIGETIKITNTSTAAQSIRFYQYVDFDLNGTPGGDYVAFSKTPVAMSVEQYEPGGAVVSETSVIKVPDYYEGAYWHNTLDNLNSGNAYTLSDTPVLGASAGPGDMTWAFEWTPTITPGGSYTISKDKMISPIPEAASIIIWSLFGLSWLFGVRVWRQRKIAVPASPVRRQPWSEESRLAIHQIIERGYDH